MRLFVAMLLASMVLDAQLIEKVPSRWQVISAPERPGASVSVSKQPPSVFRGAFLERVPGVALYEANICNNNPSGGSRIDGGKVFQSMKPMVSEIDPILYHLVALRGRRQNWKWKAARIGHWVAWGFTAAFAADAIKIGPPLIKLIGPLAAEGADKLSKEWEGEGIDPSLLTATFLTSQTQILLEPSDCQALPFLGHDIENFQTFEVEIK